MCRGIKNISCVKSARKRVLIPKVKNDKGDTISSRKGIAKISSSNSTKIYLSNETEEKLQNTLSHDTRAVDVEKKQWRR